MAINTLEGNSASIGQTGQIETPAKISFNGEERHKRDFLRLKDPEEIPLIKLFIHNFELAFNSANAKDFNDHGVNRRKASTRR